MRSQFFLPPVLPWLLVLFSVFPSRGEQSGVIVPLAEKYCSACHPAPPPAAITRGHWSELFGMMGTWMGERNIPIDEEEYRKLLDHYVAHSPEVMTLLPDDLEESPLVFESGEVGVECTSDRPRITNLNITDLDRDGKADLLVCDDVSGRVSWIRIEGGKWNEVYLANIVAPVKTSVFDFNGDGHLDIVVASLGFLSPSDDLIGSAWLLINRGDMTFEPLRLVGDIARVADVRPADFNRDGKIDFIVAKFGWRKSGGLMWLEQVTPTLFLQHEIAEINGAMQVEVLDYDGDGELDFIALLSQEHESIVLFRNDGRGNFQNEVLYRAPHPAYGTSGFQIVDLDQDGDPDIIVTNGDMMDEIPLAKPYHGVRWLENKGGEFIVRELVAMTGAYGARAKDMNGDGHLDIVVSSLNVTWDKSDAPSIIWLENDGEQNFRASKIVYSPTNLAAMDVGDINHDGIPDIIVGGFHVPGPLGRHARVTAVFGTGKLRSEDGSNN